MEGFELPTAWFVETTWISNELCLLSIWRGRPLQNTGPSITAQD